MRGFAFFLRQNSDYTPRDWCEREEIPGHWNRILPLELHAHPDTLDRSVEKELVAIARKIRIDTEALLARKRARVINGVTLVRQPPRRVELPLYRRQIHGLFEAARAEPGKALSALAFRRRQGLEMDSPIWLSCVLSEGIRRRSRTEGYDFHFVRREMGDGFSGNLRVCDLEIIYREQPRG